MRRLVQKTIVTALGLALATVPLTGCFGSNGGNDDADDTKTTETTDDTEDIDDVTETEVTQRTPTGNPDYNTWQTLGDAFAAASDNPSYGCDSTCYLGVIPVGEKNIYVIGKLTPEAYETFEQASDITTQEEALAKLPIAYKADITDKTIPQTDLDAFIGKTGQDLMNAGYVFQSYSMYGGEETAATFDNGFYSYEFTFNVSTPETASEDGGESIKTATISAVDSFGNFSNICMSPTEFTKIPELAATGLVASPTVDAVAEETPEATDASVGTDTTTTTENAEMTTEEPVA